MARLLARYYSRLPLTVYSHLSQCATAVAIIKFFMNVLKVFQSEH